MDGSSCVACSTSSAPPAAASTTVWEFHAAAPKTAPVSMRVDASSMDFMELALYLETLLVSVTRTPRGATCSIRVAPGIANRMEEYLRGFGISVVRQQCVLHVSFGPRVASS